MKKALSTFLLALVTVWGMAQVVEPVEVKKYSGHNQEWYEQQAEAWLQVVQQNPKDEWAWLNYIHARKDGQISEVSMPDEIIMSLMVQNIQDTYAYNYIMYMYGDEEFEKESAIKALKMLPEKLTVYDYETWMAYYLSVNDTDNYNKLLKGYYESGLYPKRFIIFAMNLLNSMEKNCAYIENNNKIVVAMHMIQQCMDKHTDKLIIDGTKIYNGQLADEYVKNWDELPDFQNCFENMGALYATVYSLAQSGRTVYSDYFTMSANKVMTFTEEGLLTHNSEKGGLDVDRMASIIDGYDMSWLDEPITDDSWEDEKILGEYFFDELKPYLPVLRLNHQSTLEHIKPYLEKIEKDSDDDCEMEMLLSFDLNDPEECLRIGTTLASLDDDKSHMIKRAMDMGSKEATYYYANVLMSTEKTKSEGLELLKKAAQAGVEKAEIDLAKHYIYIEEDTKVGMKMLETLSKKGNVEAMKELAEAYESENGMLYNPKKANKLRLKLAEMGDLESIKSVIFDYTNGLNVKKDLGKALEWYEKALTLEEDGAWIYINMGAIYDDDEFKGKDYAKSMKYYEKAVELGNADGWNEIAYLHARGRGVALDLNKAHECIDKAIKMDETEPNFYDSKGEFYIMQGNKDKALEMWKKVNEIDYIFYDYHVTPLDNFIRENFQEAPYDNASFSMVYPIDAQVFSINEKALRIAVDDVEVTLCAFGPDDMNVEDANALIEGMMDNVKEETEGQATIARTQKMVDNKVLKGFEAGENSENRMYIFAFDDEEHNRVVVLSFTANEKDPKEIMDKICDKIRWK